MGKAQQMSTSASLLETVRSRLFTAVIGDVLDVAGYTHQFLPPEIRAVDPEMVAVGRAMTVLEADCASDAIGHSGTVESFGLMLRALDQLGADEIYICTGSSPRYALWGEMMSTRAQAVGAAGAVLDGFHRDTRGVLATGLPVFSAGAYAQDQRVRGRVIDFRCPLEFSNGVRVNPGDLVVGDIDGVVVVPSQVEEDVVRLALEKVEGEKLVREKLLTGATTEAIFAETGIM
jgi:regulator of RNase E activity RraA